MTDHAVGYEDCDIPLASGRLRVRRWGAADAPAVVCVPGLSANLCGFDRLAERLAGDTLQLVAIDLRGRGRSEVTGAGTYGSRNHAGDVLGIADAVGAPVVCGHRPVQRCGHRHDLRAARALAGRAARARRSCGES